MYSLHMFSSLQEWSAWVLWRVQMVSEKIDQAMFLQVCCLDGIKVTGPVVVFSTDCEGSTEPPAAGVSNSLSAGQ